MLQTSTGEVVTQNPAWWQQLGALKDPEGVRQQVETILAPVRAKQPEYASPKAVQIPHTICSREDEHGKQAQSMPMKLHPEEYHFSPKQ